MDVSSSQRNCQNPNTPALPTSAELHVKYMHKVGQQNKTGENNFQHLICNSVDSRKHT